MWPLTSGLNALDDLAHRRGEDVDAADDEHVVGPPDAAEARARAAAGARTRPQLDMVVGAEAQAAARRGGAGG